MSISINAAARQMGVLMRLRLVRFALVGAAGIPVNVALLWFFHALIHLSTALAWICAFEPSALLNFFANQRFTYAEQDHLRGWEWPRRALKAQVSAYFGQVVNVLLFTRLLQVGVHYLLADAIGIVAAFVANFLLSNRFVFTPARLPPIADDGERVAELETLA